MRKILGRKFWSLGTPLGSLGPLSQGDVIVGPYGLQILVIWGPYEPPVLVACQATAENPKSVGSWCDTTKILQAGHKRRESIESISQWNNVL